MRRKQRRWRLGLILMIMIGSAAAVGLGLTHYDAMIRAPMPRLTFEKDWTLTIRVETRMVSLENRKSLRAYRDEFRKMIDDAAETWDFDRIEVRINSTGGWVTPPTALGQVLAERPEHVRVVITGDCKSAAVNVLAYGDPDEVQVTKNAVILVHRRRQIGGGITGNPAEEIEAIAELTGQSLDTVRQWYDQEKIFTAEEAVRAGWTGIKR